MICDLDSALFHHNQSTLRCNFLVQLRKASATDCRRCVLLQRCSRTFDRLLWYARKSPCKVRPMVSTYSVRISVAWSAACSFRNCISCVWPTRVSAERERGRRGRHSEAYVSKFQQDVLLEHLNVCLRLLELQDVIDEEFPRLSTYKAWLSPRRQITEQRMRRTFATALRRRFSSCGMTSLTAAVSIGTSPRLDWSSGADFMLANLSLVFKLSRYSRYASFTSLCKLWVSHTLLLQ